MVPDRPDRVRHRKIIIAEREAMDLTALSNERTLLMYIRTALGFFAAGAALIRFFGNPVFVTVGWVFIPVGVLFLIFGIFRFRHVRRVLQEQWGLRSMEEGLSGEQKPGPLRNDPHD